MNRVAETTGTEAEDFIGRDEVFEEAMKCVSRPAFWIADRVEPTSAWTEHIPFAFWIMDALRPAVLVELGSHSGTSFAAFCQAARTLGISAKCFAVDTWEGDSHAGLYSNAIYENLRQHVNTLYPDLAQLLRCAFDQAIGYFEDGSIDLLHIDGLHTYEAVKHDFESWLPKVSKRGVVLFHDTNVYARDFGVYRLWTETKQRWPHFEFIHCHGLGVLGVGPDVAMGLKRLFSFSAKPELAAAIRGIYARLGATHNLVALEKQRADGAIAQQRRIEKLHARRLEDMVEIIASIKGHLLNAFVDAAYVTYWQARVRLGAGARAKMLAQQVALISNAGLLNGRWYISQYGRTAAITGHPTLHYLLIGAKLGYNPNPVFNTLWYLETYPEVKVSRMNPLLHYIQFGADLGFSAGLTFDTRAYVVEHPEVLKQKKNPLSHYFQEERLGDLRREREEAGTAVAEAENAGQLETEGIGKNHVLVIADGAPPIFPGKNVEGGGLRCWGLARSLKRRLPNFRVTLAYNEAHREGRGETTQDGVSVVIWNERNIREITAGASVIVVSFCHSQISNWIANIDRLDQLVILDCYVPIYVEVSARNSKDVSLEMQCFDSDRRDWNGALLRGDAFLCANGAQRKFFTGVLSSLGRMNPGNYGEDPILIVPYGISEEEPVANRKPISGLVKNPESWKIMWFGGVYPWFDLRNLIDAVGIVNKAHPCELVIVGAMNPFVMHPDFKRRYEEALEHAGQPQFEEVVHFHGWVPYPDRVDWYEDCDVVVLINEIGPENEYAWRTRLVDYMWGGILVASNGGDPLSEAMFARDAAVKLPSLEPQPMADALFKALSDKQGAEKMRENLRAMRKDYHWSKVVAPLAERIEAHAKHGRVLARANAS